ncbi:aldose epimerase family protein [Streptomyces sp. V4-01]|uniref:Aldose 1-epimerase n=1 Tax=Actinacidiphila polyblastidii TaxID=3110430 RepID=A0ABU7PBV6_9ACTN|nr:aldose epimerase family protein [Streptomyces sp. V4-01]
MPRSAAAPTSEPFGATPDGRPVERWRLASPSGVGAEILTYGAILHALRVPDRAGRAESVVLSLPDTAAYAAGRAYLGAVVGRYANRIAAGRFTLDGQTHTLPVNDRGQTLHGGPDGFHRRVWQARPLPDGALRLSLHSPDGDMGFPGALEASVTYSLDDEGTLALDFTARTDRATVVNLTNHAYFTLAGAGHGDVLGHTLRVDADRFLPVTAEAIPYGPPQDVAGTPFDFTAPRALGDGIDDPDPQIKSADGYDHCWVLRPPARPDLPRTAAVLHDPASGRTMEVRTTEPGVQVYTANGLDGRPAGADGGPHGRHSAVCLETQHLPDSPNRPEYPSTVLRPGETWRSRTELRFPHLAAEGAGGAGGAA